MFSRSPAAFLNHLLTQSGWALQRLQQFSGMTARFDIAPLHFDFTIQDDGTLREAAADVSINARCTFSPLLLTRMILQDEDAFQQIESVGDSALLAEIFFLVRNLRWDAAEDLSRVTGDIAAERIVQLSQAGLHQMRDATVNLSQALVEYLTEERPLLAKPPQLTNFAREVYEVRDRMERLVKRVEILSRSGESNK